MELFLAYLALIFGISDLLGDARTRTLERRLAEVATSSARALAIMASHFTRSLSFLVLALTSLAVCAPYLWAIYFVFSGQSKRLTPLLTMVLLLVLIAASILAVLALSLFQSALPGLSKRLKGQPERRLAVAARRRIHRAIRWYERVEREIAERRRPPNPYGSNFPVFLGPVLAVVLLPALVVAVLTRFVIGLVSGIAWILVGAPVIGLRNLALRLDNPSYFNVAKYVLLVVGFLLLIAKRIAGEN